jgi:hypothetical protein
MMLISERKGLSAKSKSVLLYNSFRDVINGNSKIKEKRISLLKDNADGLKIPVKIGLDSEDERY